MMQITDLQKEQKITPLFRLGFRPFFLLGAIFAVAAILLWLPIFQGKSSLAPMGDGYWWHTHEMIFGFVAAIVAGFLLTAVQNWTGMKGLQSTPLLFLVCVWSLGRLAMLFPNIFGQHLATIIDIAFLPLVAAVLARPILAIKQYRNLFFVPLLLLFTIVNIEMHLAINNFPSISVQQAAYTSVILVTFLMSVMVGRVGPMFTANGTQTTKVANIGWLDKAANGSIALIAITLLFHPLLTISNYVYAVLFILASLFQAIRLLRWKPWITVNVPLLWSLHTAVIFMIVGMLLVGLSYISNTLHANHLWHILTIGGIGGLILAMISRVSLGHTGRMLQPPKTMSIAFLLVFIAAIVRSVLPNAYPDATLTFYHISAGLWCMSFGLFVFHYGPMLLKARKDGRPG